MTITWRESVPDEGDDLKAGAGAIRDLKTQFASGVSASMFWPGSGGSTAASAGIMQKGSFRAYVALTSAHSASDVDALPLGKLFYASDTSRFFSLVTSTDSLAPLSGLAIEHPQSLVTTARWVVSAGTTYIGAAVTFPVTYLGIPVVFLSHHTKQVIPKWPMTAKLDTVSATQFVPSSHSIDGAGNWQAETGGWVEWLSLGSVAW